MTDRIEYAESLPYHISLGIGSTALKSKLNRVRDEGYAASREWLGQEIAYLHDFEGMTFGEIAKHLDYWNAPSPTGRAWKWNQVRSLYEENVEARVPLTLQVREPEEFQELMEELPQAEKRDPFDWTEEELELAVATAKEYLAQNYEPTLRRSLVLPVRLSQSEKRVLKKREEGAGALIAA